MIKFCKKCNIETERYNDGHCKPCARSCAVAYYSANLEKVKARQAARYAANPKSDNARSNAYYAANREKCRAANAAWCAANPDKKKAGDAAWVAANSERCKATSAAYYKTNLEKILAKRAVYRASNREKCNADIAAYRKAYPEKAKASTAAYRAANLDKVKAADAVNRKTNRVVRLIYEHNRRARKRANGGVLSKGLSAKLFKLQRGLCPCCKQPLGNDPHLDHKMPIDLGGANEDWNMQLLRKTCNLQKSAKHPNDFMRSRGFLI